MRPSSLQSSDPAALGRRGTIRLQVGTAGWVSPMSQRKHILLCTYIGWVLGMSPVSEKETHPHLRVHRLGFEDT